MRRVLLAAALCAVALSGCDSLRHLFRMPTNNDPVVIILNGKIHAVDPDPLQFTNKGQEKVIIWSLEDDAFRAGFRFADATKGIKIERQTNGPPQDIGREFTGHEVLGQGKKFRVKNKHSDEGTYKYSVRIIDPNGNEQLLDPFIVNGR